MFSLTLSLRLSLVSTQNIYHWGQEKRFQYLFYLGGGWGGGGGGISVTVLVRIAIQSGVLTLQDFILSQCHVCPVQVT